MTVRNDRKCRSCYDALRGVADRLLGAACVLLQRRTLFDPDHGAPAVP